MKEVDGIIIEYIDIVGANGQKIRQTVKRLPDGTVENIFEEIDDAGRVKPIKICGLCLAQNTKVFGSNQTIAELSDANSQVQTLEKDGSVSVRKVLGKYSRKVSDYVKVFVGGEELKSSSDHEFKTNKGWFSAGSLRKGMMLFSLALNSFVPVDSMAFINEPLQVEGLALGNVEGYGVGSLGIMIAPSNGWCVEGLDLVGHQRFNTWTTKYNSSLKYGVKTADDAAEAIAQALAKKLDEIGITKNKAIIEALEDSQGRMTFVIKKDGVTHDIVTIQKNIDGNNVVQSYNRAYNSSANSTYPAPASANRMVPNFDGTAYIDIDCQSVINQIKQRGEKGIRIKMTRGNRNADFSAANDIMKTELGLTTYTKPSNYTWHHMDDLEIINGEAYCTIQLVETSVHSASGMGHTGAVGQLERYFKNDILDLLDD